VLKLSDELLWRGLMDDSSSELSGWLANGLGCSATPVKYGDGSPSSVVAVVVLMDKHRASVGSVDTKSSFFEDVQPLSEAHLELSRMS
jgi:hypothetical protein